LRENIKIEKQYLVCPQLTVNLYSTVQFVSEKIGIDGGKKINNRKRTILVDKSERTLAIKVTEANISDNQNGILAIDLLKGKVSRFKKNGSRQWV
jgi:hypothetical protein